jgi:ribonuclease HI
MIAQVSDSSPALRAATIAFDGGSRGNPGKGYGSFTFSLKRKPGEKRTRFDGDEPRVIRLYWGADMTNNEAEYETLICALKEFLAYLEKRKEDPKGIALEIQGDSRLVINQVKGEWKAHEKRLAERRDTVRDLLSRFGQYRLVYQPRVKSVALFGH